MSASTRVPNAATDEPLALSAKTRRRLGKVAPPTDRRPKVRHGIIGGVPVVWVELSGRHGQRKEVLLTTEHWKWAEKQTPWWTVAIDGAGKSKQVTSGRIAPGRWGKQSPETHPRATLARSIAHAPEGTVVRYRDDDFLNLLPGNLEVLTRAEFFRRVGDLAWLMSGIDREAAVALWLPIIEAALAEEIA